MSKLSIIIPAFNEARTIGKVIQDSAAAAREMEIDAEIIVVDDASTDETGTIVGNITSIPVIYIRLPYNQGKGAALKEGFQRATGEIVIIQDADLEYSPSDYHKLVEPIRTGKADVVYGTRFRGEYQRVLYFWHYAGNTMLTMLSNIFTNLNLSDMETGYKVFRIEVIKAIAPRLRSKRFGIEPEITGRIAHGRPALPDGSRGRWRIFEVPINYYGRTYEEGKKIGWWDGVKAIGAIVYFNVFDR